MPDDKQLELMDLQCNSTLKQNFVSVGIDSFYQYLLPNYPTLTTVAVNAYLSEQAFSLVNLSKTKHRARLSNAHLNDILKWVTTQDLIPDIDALVKVKRCQVSGASTNL